MKKILNYLVALALVFIQLLPVANAATITINKSVEGQVYNAYKIFDVTRDENSYAYSIDSTNEWFEDVKNYVGEEGEKITLTKVASSDTKYVVDASEIDATHFAAYLNDNKEGKTVTGTATATGTTTTITVSKAGYYFVDSSLGALCILHTAADTFTIDEKNAEPTIKKEASQTSASVGETVTFTITITAGGKADTNYILHDKMTDGLDLNETSFTVKVGTTDVEEENYEIKTSDLEDDCTFEIVFNEGYTAGLEKDTVITVTYTATVNEKAIVNSEVTNEATLQYGNTTSQTSKVTVVNFDFDIVKTDGTNSLEGAQFKLYDAITGGNEIKLIKDGDFYRPIKAEETAVDYIEAGTARIKGLASGTYYLEETKAPDGYNQLTERVAVELNADLTVENAIEVVNTTGAQLPSTGGMGTVLFIAIGSMMVLGFGVLLVTKLRLSKMSI